MKYPTKGVSFPDLSLWIAAKQRAGEQGRSFSNYVRRLIEKDLEGAGVSTLQEQAPPYKVTAIRRPKTKTPSNTP